MNGVKLYEPFIGCGGIQGGIKGVVAGKGVGCGLQGFVAVKGLT
jgi:hypothetical protein